MKYLVILAITFIFAACDSGASSNAVVSAQGALDEIMEAKTLLEGVQSKEDAMAIEADFADLGSRYSSSMEKLSLLDQSDVDVAQQLVTITPKIAAAFQGLMMEINALQARNPEAAQVLIDELKAFKPKR